MELQRKELETYNEELPPYSFMHNEDGQMQSMYTYGPMPFVVPMKLETQHQPKAMTNAPWVDSMDQTSHHPIGTNTTLVAQ